MRAGIVTILALGFVVTEAGFAQDADDLSEFEPAVDTSAVVDEEPAVDTSAADLDDSEELVAETAPDTVRSVSRGEVMDRMTLSRTEITGNQELPKVMYIVPWQKSDPGDLMGRPVNTLLDEILAPVDREEFIRQVGFYNDLYVQDEE